MCYIWVVFNVLPYITESGSIPFEKWLSGLRDTKAIARTLARITALKEGHFGDCKPVGTGVWELRIDVGAGYRVYYSRVGIEIVLLLAGGNKQTQQRDIAKAITYLHDYKERFP